MMYLKKYILDSSWLNDETQKYYKYKWKNSEIYSNNIPLILKFSYIGIQTIKKTKQKKNKTDISIINLWRYMMYLKRYISMYSYSHNVVI